MVTFGALARRSDEGLTLETSGFEIFHGGNSPFINSFYKTIFLHNFKSFAITTLLKFWYLSPLYRYRYLNLRAIKAVP